MSRMTWVLSIALMLILVSVSVAFAADTPRYRHSDKNRADGVINALVGGESAFGPATSERTFGVPAAIAAAPQTSPGLQVGTTTYDYQHNGSTERQVDQRNGTVQVTWMFSDQFSTALGRNVRWNKASVTRAPKPANGSAERMVSGWMKLS